LVSGENPDSKLADLSSEAIKKARTLFCEKNPRLVEDVTEWDDLTFLNKAKLIREGQLTKAALLLLGNPESTTLLDNSQGRISWILKSEDNIVLDYEHFGPPFILTIDEVFQKIRNLNYRYMTGESIFPTEIRQYDDFVLREALNNAVAHQDYTLNAKINLVEFPNKIRIANLGDFLPGSIEEVIERDLPSERYRNPFLAEAMVSLNLIDTVGSGIRKMMLKQIKRTFPLPSYLFDTTPEGLPRVQVTIFGEILDKNYTAALLKHTDLTITEVILLDKVQKKETIDKASADILRKKKLIEGRYPSIYVASSIALATQTEADYLNNAGLNDQHYMGLIEKFLETYPNSPKAKLFEFLNEKLPAILSEEQKKKKVGNLLQQLARQGKIESIGKNRQAVWIKK